MKNKLFALMLAASCALFLVNCSKNNSTPANNAVANGGVCPVPGQVYTTQGCLPQSASCGTNYGYLNGSCYPVTTSNGINSMCGSTGYVNGYSQPGVGCLNQQGSCLSTDVVNTQMGTLTVGVCQPYCAQYGKKYGYLNGQCYPAY